MTGFFKKPFKLDEDTILQFQLAVWNAVGVFLFILFFRPFGAPDFSLSDTLIFDAGMALIIFVTIVVFLIGLPLLAPRLFLSGGWEEGPSDLLNLGIWISSTVGFVFYIRYVGHLQLPFITLARVVFVCLVPPLLVKLKFYIRTLKRGMASYSPDSQTPHFSVSDISIKLDNGAERLDVTSRDLLYLKAADNYVEVVDCVEGTPRFRLIRTTLRRLDAELADIVDLQRCHRAYIVNLKNVHRLERTRNGYNLILNHISDFIPVSRAYQVTIKNLLNRA